RATRDLAGHPGRTPGSTPSMEAATIRAAQQPDNGLIYMNNDVDLVVTFRAPQTLSDVTFGFVVKNQLQAPVFGVNTMVIPTEPLDRPIRHRGTVTGRIAKLPLMPG